jgi:hypothetical protein
MLHKKDWGGDSLPVCPARVEKPAYFTVISGDSQAKFGTVFWIKEKRVDITQPYS